MVRVIAGSRRGKNLKTLDGRDTRPTSNRVREALFNIIQFSLPDAAVLDLFGGSGALAVESLSRGARSAVVCDSSKQAVQVIRENLQSCSFPAEVLCCDYAVCLDRLRASGAKFDVVFLDPPYAMDAERSNAVRFLTENDLLTPGGFLVVESEAEQSTELPSCAEVFDVRCYGKTKLEFIRRQEAK